MDKRFLVVFGACLTQFTVIGVLFAYGLFVKELEAEFGWSRTFLSACSSAAFLMMGVLAIGGGRLSDRFGPRPVLAAAGLTYGVGVALMSQVAAPWQLFAVFATFVAIGMSTHDVVTLSTIAKWFERRRGIMSGVVKVGTAAGQMTVPLIAAALIAAFGWRGALLALGVAAGALLLVAALAMSRPPDGPGGRSGAPGMDFVEARRSRPFRTLCAIQFLFFPALMSVPLHLVVHAQDLGFTPTAAASLLSAVAGASVAGRLIVGGFADRIGGRNAFVLCFIPLIAGLLAFAEIETATALFLAGAVYGFAHGGLFTVVSPTVASYFGMRAHGAIFGMILFCGTVGGAVGPIA
ncbi:MAG: MFS transporter, partial [Pseudomonadota bacterium]